MGARQAFPRARLSLLLLAVCMACRSDQESLPPKRPNPDTVRTEDSVHAGLENTVDCDSAETTLDMRVCLGIDLRTAQLRLTLVSDTIREKLPDSLDVGFDKADKDWKSYVASECSAAESWYFPGTMTPLVAIGCQLDLTEQRVSMLRSLYSISSERDSTFHKHGTSE
jgi:uncharacterized protein YecT (DUF1311 family)